MKKIEAETEQPAPLAIRTAQLGEYAWRTGQVGSRYCLRLTERINDSTMAKCQYRPVIGPALFDFGVEAHIVLFHDMVSQTGERFIYPQEMHHSAEGLSQWQKCERNAFLEYPHHWIAIDYDAEQRMYVHGYLCDQQFMDGDYSDFAVLLEQALAPLTIDNVDHPLIKRAMCVWGSLDDKAYEIGWTSLAQSC